jgi:type I restriction enzyme S subunit
MKNGAHSWTTKPLAELAKAEWGNTSITKASYVESGFPAFSATGADGFLPKAEWEGPAVVLSAIGARCGKCFYADGKWTAIKNTIVIQADSSTLSHKFLFYYLNDATRWKISGSGQPFITLKTVRETNVPLPALPEQVEIVAEIEKQFTRLEAGVAALRRVQANLKRYRAAVLKAACEGRLVSTEAELAKTENRKFETGEALLARLLTERRQNWQGRGKYKDPAAPEPVNLPLLPDGYALASFGQICRVQGGFAFKSSDYVKEGVPLIRISNLVNGRVQVSDDTVFLPQEFATANPAFLLRKGDVLIAMSGATTGKMATMEDDIPALLNQRVGRFLLSSPKLSDAKFVSCLVMQITQKVLKEAYGAAQPNISPAEIEEMPIPLPPLAEQTRIVAEVERRLSVVEELEAVVSANLRRVTRLRQSVLQQAFDQTSDTDGEVDHSMPII